ncbi:hypothetical protein WN48_10117 [Eufriesea mexicana]|nr:hypothetical protein WN48_10117 [Eufriesea mexicana]
MRARATMRVEVPVQAACGHYKRMSDKDRGVGDRSYRTGSDTEGAATTDNPTTPFPTPPPTLTPNHRQASPFPLENTNSRRHHYNGSISSERSRNGNGAELIRAASVLRETVYAAPSKKTSTGGGTLGRRTRRGHTSALSSSSTASDRSETVFPDEHSRMHLTNDTGRDSPPEPAPPEVPPRGPSLHATHTLRTQQNRNGCPPNATGNFAVPGEQMQTEKYSGAHNKLRLLCKQTFSSLLTSLSLHHITVCVKHDKKATLTDAEKLKVENLKMFRKETN